MARPEPTLGRLACHVVLVGCWLLVALMAVLMWGPHVSDYKTEIIVGRSMEPTIPLWSVIVVEPVEPAAIRTGDVIVAEPAELGGRKVTHRVTAREPGEHGKLVFRTRGDNNDTTDPWKVIYEDEAWRVVEHVPHVGWIMAKAQTRAARLLLVVLPVLLILAQVLRWIWRDGSVTTGAVDCREYDDDELDDWLAAALMRRPVDSSPVPSPRRRQLS